MEVLFTPNIGLMVWTVTVFLFLVFILGRFAWKPILKGLFDREEAIKKNIRSAEDAKKSAEDLKSEYEKQLAGIQAKTREILAQAQKDSQKLRDDIVKTAQDESARLTEKTRLQLAEEQRRLVQELRSEVTSLSVAAAEKILRKSVDKSLQDEFVRETLQGLDKWADKN